MNTKPKKLKLKLKFRSLCLLLATTVLSTTPASSCPHNFAQDEPVTSVYLAKKITDENNQVFSEVIASISGKGNGVENQNPMKLFIVAKNATLDAKKLDQEVVDKMNAVVNNARNYQNRGAALSRGARGISQGAGPSSSLKTITIGNQIVSLRTFKEPGPKVFSNIAQIYNIKSDHLEAMNKKLQEVLSKGYKVVVSEVQPLKSEIVENVNIGLIVKTPLFNLNENLSNPNFDKEYIDTTTQLFILNLWISRASSGGVVMLFEDKTYSRFKNFIEYSPTIYFDWKMKYNRSSDPIARSLDVNTIQNLNNGDLDIEFKSLREIIFFEEKYSRSLSHLEDLEVSGGSILYSPGK